MSLVGGFLSSSSSPSPNTLLSVFQASSKPGSVGIVVDLVLADEDVTVVVVLVVRGDLLNGGLLWVSLL